MFDLPLFPLNTVLFPGMPLNLHIFEERYKRMVRICLQTRQPFGVVLIKHGFESYGPIAKPHYIGCTARILESEPLSDGRMNIVALGQKRFRILSLDYERAYLVGRVELYPLERSHPEFLEQKGNRLRPMIRRYMQILTEASEANLDPRHLPHDPLVLAYLAAVLLQIPPEQKQKLLTLKQATDLLNDLLVIYRRELALLRALLSGEARQSMGHFSVN
jgi:Lon protease-like protein